MNEIQIFKNEQFGEVRTITEGDKVLFCGSDVAKALGYKNPSKALSDHCRGITKRYTGVETGKKADGSPAVQQVSMNFIPEGDIYRLAAKSELPGADKFESWIFDEVLPSIHKHGGYLTPDKLEEVLLSPDTLIRLATDLKNEREKIKALKAQAEKDKPKVLFADAVSASSSSILVGELAKLLRQNGIEVGQKRLFQQLRDDGYLIKRKGSDYNMPTQYAMEKGLFEIKETVVSHASGYVSINRTPKITGKGQTYFVNRYLTEN